MPLTNMVVYNQTLQTMTIEMVDQMVEGIAAASRGAINLTSVRNEGDFSKETFWQNLASARRRVDRYAANSAQAATNMQQLESVGVKVAGGFGPVLLEPSQITWIQQDPAAAMAAISRYFAEALIQDQLNTGLLAVVQAIANQSALVNDVSGSPGDKITHAALNDAHAKFGDMSGQIVTDVMSGKMFHQLIGENITNANRLFESDRVQVVDILGRAIVVTDAPALFGTGVDHVVGLVPGALEVSDNADLVTNMDTTNGKQRIETTWQADYTFNLKCKGYAWDEANGGKSPDDTEIGTGTNWDKVTLDKFTAGVLCIGDS